MELDQESMQLMNIFMPHAVTEISRIRENKKRFVHYTNAEAALNIIKKKEVWMRQSTCMSDYMEIQHGIDCLAQAYKESEQGKTFKGAMVDSSVKCARGLWSR